MPQATVKLTVEVTLDVPAELAAKCTRDDLIEMARSSVPDSSVTADPANGLGGAINGTQVIADDGVAQEDEKQQPIFADVYIEHDTFEDAEITFEDDGFTKAEEEA